MVVVLVVCLLLASPAQAVPPPDFIINVGSQVMQFFSLALLFLTAIFSSIYQFVRVRFTNTQMKTNYWVIALLVIILVATTGAMTFGSLLKERAMTRLQLAPEARVEESLPVMALNEVLDENPMVVTTTVAVVSSTSAIPTIEDDVTAFIRRYYQAIADHDLQTAYNFSKKTVPYQTFQAWYVDTERISLTNIRRLDPVTTVLEVNMVEKGISHEYEVTMSVERDAHGIPVRVGSSSVRLLGTTMTPASTAALAALTASSLPFKLSNDQFKYLLAKNTPVFVLDAREDIEHEYGSFPGSAHIRFADLKAGQWASLPKDQPIVVLCWSGIRGSQVASFLKTKKIKASYLATGVDGWVANGGVWMGTTKFLDRFPDERYRIVFSTSDVKKYVKNGTVLVDAREPAGRAKHPLANAIPISLLSTPSTDLPGLLARIPKGASVITVCSEYVDCFEAKLVGVETERAGHAFLGRYVY